MSELLHLDYRLFFLINSEWSHTLLDHILPFLRNKYLWFPVYIGIVSWVLMNHKRGLNYLYLLSLVSCVVITDLVNSQLLKPFIDRVRPCNEIAFIDEVVARVGGGFGQSFPSNHAANHFALSVLIILLFRPQRYISLILILWASIISYAQVYVGLHYPLDVFGGALIGIMLARLWSELTIRELAK